MTKAVLMDVLDKQQKKIIPMHPKRAVYLSTAYPNRFSLVYPNLINQQLEKNKMPALPTATKSLDNGLHILNALEVKTVSGQYGPQEEVLCLKEGTNDVLTRVWVPHNNLKRITEASKAGLVHIDGENWEVIPGSRFQVFVAGGKIAAVMPAPPVDIQSGNGS